MTTQRLAALVLTTLTVTALSACSVQLGAPADSPATVTPAAPTAPAPSADSPPPAAPPTGTTTTPASGVWAHELVSGATRPAGATTATVKNGTARYDHATSLWVGCHGATDEVTLELGGRHRLLTGDLALRAEAPEDLIVHVLVLADGSPVQNVQLDATDGAPAQVPLNVVLTGVQKLTFQSKTVAGTCSPSETSYAVLGDGRVS